MKDTASRIAGLALITSAAAIAIATVTAIYLAVVENTDVNVAVIVGSVSVLLFMVSKMLLVEGINIFKGD